MHMFVLLHIWLLICFCFHVFSRVDKFFDQLIDDLECYCLHAKRKTIQKEDFELHLRRVREVHDKKSLDALVLDHLPMEYWRDLLDLPIKKK